MERRAFLKGGVAAGLGALCAPAACRTGRGDAARVMTVTGEVSADVLGATLPHEHVLVDFIGAEQVTPERYDADEAFERVLPHLHEVKALGCRALVECTPAYIGRDPDLLRRLSAASGLHLLTNTGYYGAAKDKYLPRHAFEETADQLSARWVREWVDGIGDTGIRPGFIKIGVDSGSLSEIDRKLVVAAARTHVGTGLTIASHTGPGVPALEQLEVLREEGVDASAWIWVHAQSERDGDLHPRAAERGAWVEFDGIGPKSVERHVALVSEMRRRGFLDRVLVSHDAGWYRVGEPQGGQFRAFDTLFTAFLPALRDAGFNDSEIHRLMVENPARAFAVGVRAR